MEFFMVKRAFFVLLLALIAGGCRSELYYQHRAVERARKYLLENCRDLSSADINFVRFNAPLLLHSPVIGSHDEETRYEKLVSELQQICVTWMIPGKKDLYMVFGVSGARMDGWYPNRIILRDYTRYQPVLAQAVSKTRKFAQDNFFDDLGVTEANHVRFSFPYLIRTKFDLNFNPDGKKSPEELAKIRKDAEDKIQYSLVWKLDGRNLVFAGLSKPGLGDWDFSFAQIIDDKELGENTVKVVMIPADGLKKLPEEELKLTGGK